MQLNVDLLFLLVSFLFFLYLILHSVGIHCWYKVIKGKKTEKEGVRGEGSRVESQ